MLKELTEIIEQIASLDAVTECLLIILLYKILVKTWVNIKKYFHDFFQLMQLPVQYPRLKYIINFFMTVFGYYLSVFHLPVIIIVLFYGLYLSSSTMLLYQEGFALMLLLYLMVMTWFTFAQAERGRLWLKDNGNYIF
jgi:hypothetical protein